MVKIMMRAGLSVVSLMTLMENILTRRRRSMNIHLADQYSQMDLVLIYYLKAIHVLVIICLVRITSAQLLSLNVVHHPLYTTENSIVKLSSRHLAKKNLLTKT